MTQHFYSAFQTMRLKRTLQHPLAWARATDKKVNILVAPADSGNHTNEHVNPLALSKPAQHHYDGSFALRGARCCRWIEVRCVNSVRDDRYPLGVGTATKNGVFLGSMGDADGMVSLVEHEAEELVAKDRSEISEAEERVVGEDGRDADGFGMQNGFKGDGAEGGVRVHNGDVLADDDVPNKAAEGEEAGVGGGACKLNPRYVQNFHARCQVADSEAGGVVVCEDCDAMAREREALRKLVQVRFDTANVRKEEVACHQH